MTGVIGFVSACWIIFALGFAMMIGSLIYATKDRDYIEQENDAQLEFMAKWRETHNWVSKAKH